MEWLRDIRDWYERPRLAEQLHVRDGWARAVEMVLDFRLEAVCVDSSGCNTRTSLDQFSEGGLTLFDARAAAAQAPGDAASTVAASQAAFSGGTKSMLPGP